MFNIRAHSKSVTRTSSRKKCPAKRKATHAQTTADESKRHRRLEYEIKKYMSTVLRSNLIRCKFIHIGYTSNALKYEHSLQ